MTVNRTARKVILACGIWMFLAALIAAATATGFGTVAAIGCLVLGMVFVRETRRSEYR